MTHLIFDEENSKPEISVILLYSISIRLCLCFIKIKSIEMFMAQFHDCTTIAHIFNNKKTQIFFCFKFLKSFEITFISAKLILQSKLILTYPWMIA